MEELKPCPFCGGEGTHQIGDMINPLTVYCLNCEIAIPTEIWQQRHIEDELRSHIEAMEYDMIEDYH